MVVSTLDPAAHAKIEHWIHVPLLELASAEDCGEQLVAFLTELAAAFVFAAAAAAALAAVVVDDATVGGAAAAAAWAPGEVHVAMQLAAEHSDGLSCGFEYLHPAVHALGDPAAALTGCA